MSGTMTPYIVQQGDYLAKLAFMHGFEADGVWNDPKNADLRKLRPDPNVLAPGDVLYIPAKAETEALPIKKGTENKYVAKVPTVEVTLVFKDGDGPLANEPCEIQGLGSAAPVTTDGEGKLKLDAPVTARELAVHFPNKNAIYNVRVGDMDPDTEASGLRKRLENLGLYPRNMPESADREELLHLALIGFQQKMGIDLTGEIDEATRDALKREHLI